MIYVHVPFCKSFCTYCGFYSELCRSSEAPQVQKLYLQGVLGEIEARRAELEAAASHGPRTLYFGGGTPSVLPADSLIKIIDALGCYGPFDELTVEVNPDDVTPALVASLVGAGVNRISMGVQSLSDEILHWMNRRHTAASALAAYDCLRKGGVRNISLDLIFGLSQLSDELWREEVRRVVALRPEHISAYALSVEEGSALAELVEAGRYQVASDEQYRAQYDILCAELSAAGYHHYEISNFALPGFEAKHNSGYWEGCQYAGLGPGAHSYAPALRRRSWNSEQLTGWLAESEILSDEDLRTEEVMLRLRTSAGIAAARLEQLCGHEKIARALQLGAILKIGENYRIPEDRFFISDSIIAELL